MFKYMNIYLVFLLLLPVSIIYANDCEDNFSRLFEKQDDMHRFLKTYKADAYTDGHDSRVFNETAIDTYQSISKLIMSMNTDCQKDLSQVFTPDLKKKLQGRIQKDYQNYKSEYEQAKRRVPIITSLKWIDPLVTRLIDGTKLLLENFNKNS